MDFDRIASRVAQDKLASMSRFCGIYKAVNGKWYMDLARKEYGEQHDATTYGPFNSEEQALDYLDNFSNPGSWITNDSGNVPVPTRSPNGTPVQRPQSNSYSGFGFRTR